MNPKIKSIKTLSVASRDEVRSFAKEGVLKNADGLVRVKYDAITIRKGFNIRTSFEGLEELADSIEAVGQKEPIDVDFLKDGTAALNDGQRRYLAIGILRDRSPELKAKYEYVRAIINSRDLTDTDRLLQMLSTQDKDSFSPLDLAEGYRRLRDGWMGEKGLILTDIAKITGKSIAYVEQKLRLADSSEEEKDMVRSGKVSATALQELVRKEADPEKRVQRVKSANATGKKLKVKNVKMSDVGAMAQKQIDLSQKIQNHQDISVIPGEVLNLVQEMETIARGILKLA